MIRFLDDAIFTLLTPWPMVIVVLAVTVIAIGAYLARALTAGGALCAFVMGVTVFWTTRAEGFLLFMLFFLSCNVVGKISKRLRKGKTEIAEKKGHRRDVMQVVANGLMTTIAALLWFFTSKTVALIMFGAAVAEATSDTFAGEVGRLSKSGPVSIRNFRPVPVGMSGGVTFLGMVGAFLSSAMIAFCWYIWFQGVSVYAAVLVCLMGFAGAVMDSYLGASVQAHYVDPDTGMLTENDEKDGRKLELAQGIRWVDNDMVNLMSNVFSSVFALGMGALIVKL
ncbi:MAG: DUF92 domain-containing protein [Spirochaetales bacterium]|nr:DUF92 domain-containing protein [Spirochaetales bacterium]